MAWAYRPCGNGTLSANTPTRPSVTGEQIRLRACLEFPAFHLPAELTEARGRFRPPCSSPSSIQRWFPSWRGTKSRLRFETTESCHFLKPSKRPRIVVNLSGWGGIRTHGGIAPSPVFKTGAIGHSATHPSSISIRRNVLHVHDRQPAPRLVHRGADQNAGRLPLSTIGFDAYGMAGRVIVDEVT